MIECFRDVRRLPLHELEAFLLGDKSPMVVSACQMAALRRRVRDREVMAVVPDFLEYARLLSVGQAKALIERAGGLRSAWPAVLRAGVGILNRPAQLLKQDFWLVAEALLRFDLALLQDFCGVIVLHPYLTDFAVSLGKASFLQQFFRLADNWCYAGVWTYQFPLTISALARCGLAPQAVIFASAPQNHHVQTALRQVRENPLFSDTHFLLDLEPVTVGAPSPVDNLLATHPGIEGLIVVEQDGTAQT